MGISHRVSHRIRKSGFGGRSDRPRVIPTNGAALFRDVITLTLEEALSSLGKLSSIRWETLAFCKSGAALGVNYGSLSKHCYKQVEETFKLITDVIGEDPTVLEPGYYSKLFRNRFSPILLQHTSFHIGHR